MLPWLAVHGRLGKAKYQCQPCLQTNDYNARRTMRCGYVRPEDWGEAMASWGYIEGAPILHPETCPGYTSTLPEALEVAEAWGWWEKSQLGNLGNLPQRLSVLVSLFNREIVASRNYLWEKLREQ